MQAGDALVLQDIHTPPAPSWWPPAPGWWLLAAIALLAAGAVAWWLARRRRRRRAFAKLFDEALAGAASPAEQVAAMSALLRRAARQRRPGAERLEGDDWLRFLDRDLSQPVFAAGAGQVLRDGAFRRDLGAAEIEGLRQVVRERFLRWMDGRG